MKDMTEGNELKLIVWFVIPFLVSSVLQQLYNIVDKIVVGKFVGEAALASVQISAQIMMLMVSVTLGLTMGTTVLVAQYFGGKDFEQIRKTVSTTYIVLVLAAAVLTTAAGLIFCDLILAWLDTPIEVLPQAKIYLQIMFIGSIGVFGYNATCAILRGVGDSMSPLIYLGIAVVMNIALDLLFVCVFGWGVSGAAWATIISQILSFVFSIFHMRIKHDIFRFGIKNLVFDRNIFKLTLKIGLPSGMQQVSIALAFLFIQRIINKFGVVAVAGFTGSSAIDSIAFLPIMNFSLAVSAFVGQNVGAQKFDRVKRGYRASLILSCSLAVIISVVLFRYAPWLMSIFYAQGGSEAISIGVTYLRIVAPFYIVAAYLFVNTGLLRGAGDALVAMIISVSAVWLVRIPIAHVFASRMGVNGIWWSAPFAWSCGALAGFFYYLSGRWKRKSLVQAEATAG